MPLLLTGALLCLVLVRAARAERTLGLTEAIRLARLNRSEVSQANLDIERARVSLLSAWLERIQLRVQVSAAELYQNLTIGYPEAALGGPVSLCGTSDHCREELHRFEAHATLSIPLWSGLSLEADVARARALERAARAQKRSVLRDVALETANAYWAVRRSELLRDIVDSALRRSRTLEQITRRRVDAGVAPPIDYARAHVRGLRMALELNTLDTQLAAARAELAAALQVDGDLVLDEDPLKHTLPAPALASAERAALGMRPELEEVAARETAQAQAVRSLKGKYWPQIGVVGEGLLQNQSFFLPGRQENLTLGVAVGVQMSWIIFDTLGTFNAVKDAGLVRARITQERQRVRYVVTAQVRTAHARLAQALERRATVEQAVLAARDNLTILRRRYEVGAALIIELITADAELTLLELEQVDTSVTVAEAHSQLAGAVGTL